MRDEERRYDEASQLCRAAADLKGRVESLENRVQAYSADGTPDRKDLERARRAVAEALGHLRRYREKLVGGSPDEVGVPPAGDGGAAKEMEIGAG